MSTMRFDAINKISFASLLSILTLSSCKDKSERNLAIIKSLTESLTISNRTLEASTSDVFTSLNNKLKDAGTAQFAEASLKRAKMVQSISINTYNYIEKIKTELIKAFPETKYNVKKFFLERETEIYESLMNYRKKLLKVDPKINAEFQNSIIGITPSFDSIPDAGKKLAKTFFANADREAAIAMLTKIQNNIRLNENRVITFCHESIAIDLVIRDYDANWPFVTQSSTIVQKNDPIEIIAGVGSLNVRSNPRVFVYGRLVPREYDGVARYKLKAPSNPGKYYVPIKINYTDQDGRQQTVHKEVEYTVAAIQKQ